MGPWKWYATLEGEWDSYGFESDTREEAIQAIMREFGNNVVIQVCEARFSTDRKYEGEEFVPFLRMRNKETIDLSLREVPA